MNWKHFAPCLVMSLSLLAGCVSGTPTPLPSPTVQNAPLATSEAESSPPPSQPPSTQTAVPSQPPPTQTAVPSRTPTVRATTTSEPDSAQAVTTATLNEEDGIISGQSLATSTPNSSLCVRRTEWFSYTIQSGDTLSRIAQQAGITLAVLKEANCLSSDVIFLGDRLYVPKEISSSDLVIEGPNTDPIIAVTDAPSGSEGNPEDRIGITPRAAGGSIDMIVSSPSATPDTGGCNASDESCHPGDIIREPDKDPLEGCSVGDEACFSGDATPTPLPVFPTATYAFWQPVCSILQPNCVRPRPR